MLIHLNTNDFDVVQRVIEEIKHSPYYKIHDDPDAVQQYVPGSGEHIITYGPLPVFEDKALHRWSHMFAAAAGGRLWTDETEQRIASPLYAGSLNKIASLRQVIVDAAFAEARAVYYRAFGVNYLGRVDADPRTLILLDNKKDKTLHPSGREDVYNILTSFPEDPGKSEGSWESIGLVSAGNVNKLEEFLDYLSETNVLTFSTGGASKLKFIGRDFGHIGTPTPDPKYGLAIRDAASRLKPTLSA